MYRIEDRLFVKRSLAPYLASSFLNPVIRSLNRSLDIGRRLEIGTGGTALRLLHEGKLREVPLPLPVQIYLDGSHRGAVSRSRIAGSLSVAPAASGRTICPQAGQRRQRSNLKFFIALAAASRT